MGMDSPSGSKQGLPSNYIAQKDTSGQYGYLPNLPEISRQQSTLGDSLQQAGNNLASMAKNLAKQAQEFKAKQDQSTAYKLGSEYYQWQADQYQKLSQDRQISPDQFHPEWDRLSKENKQYFIDNHPELKDNPEALRLFTNGTYDVDNHFFAQSINLSQQKMSQGYGTQISEAGNAAQGAIVKDPSMINQTIDLLGKQYNSLSETMGDFQPTFLSKQDAAIANIIQSSASILIDQGRVEEATAVLNSDAANKYLDANSKAQIFSGITNENNRQIAKHQSEVSQQLTNMVPNMIANIAAGKDIPQDTVAWIKANEAFLSPSQKGKLIAIDRLKGRIGNDYKTYITMSDSQWHDVQQRTDPSLQPDYNPNLSDDAEVFHAWVDQVNKLRDNNDRNPLDSAPLGPDGQPDISAKVGQAIDAGKDWTKINIMNEGDAAQLASRLGTLRAQQNPQALYDEVGKLLMENQDKIRGIPKYKFIVNQLLRNSTEPRSIELFQAIAMMPPGMRLDTNNDVLMKAALIGTSGINNMWKDYQLRTGAKLDEVYGKVVKDPTYNGLTRKTDMDSEDQIQQKDYQSLLYKRAVILQLQTDGMTTEQAIKNVNKLLDLQPPPGVSYESIPQKPQGRTLSASVGFGVSGVGFKVDNRAPIPKQYADQGVYGSTVSYFLGKVLTDPNEVLNYVALKGVHSNYTSGEMFDKLYSLTFNAEGGSNVDNSNPNSPSKFGIDYASNASALTYYGINSAADMGKLTKDQAIQIAYNKYFMASGSDAKDAKDPGLASFLFDVYYQRPKLYGEMMTANPELRKALNVPYTPKNKGYLDKVIKQANDWVVNQYSHFKDAGTNGQGYINRGAQRIKNLEVARRGSAPGSTQAMTQNQVRSVQLWLHALGDGGITLYPGSTPDTFLPTVKKGGRDTPLAKPGGGNLEFSYEDVLKYVKAHPKTSKVSSPNIGRGQSNYNSMLNK